MKPGFATVEIIEHYRPRGKGDPEGHVTPAEGHVMTTVVIDGKSYHTGLNAELKVAASKDDLTVVTLSLVVDEVSFRREPFPSEVTASE